ncbi:hypothetical protein HD600_001489 [Microbacterium ginsengiterrae]|uniref:Uncharacterized protein n=1 Tax=Microbacterium ginsengiterrae TaxID=546115 RepID=A0A7W9FBA9_9MICO|nr:alpha-amylase family protein [Microbacterium ginsengiterrae]MBB5742992.1 hypothetical protein [Microbacterium ginsengiterrae]
MTHDADTLTALDPAAARLWNEDEQRWTQLTFVEDDPLHFDLDAWIDVLERTDSTAICLSAGGYMAFYPTRIPLHYASRHLGERDLFGEVVAAAKQRGLAVMARIDPHAVHEDVREAHPEWIARNEDGSLRRHWAFPEAWVTCAYGAYNWEFMTDVAREIVSEYDVDAIFANRWQGHGPGYTDEAQALFRAATGRALPTSADPADGEAWRAYTSWRRNRLSALVSHWDDAVRAVDPNVRFVPNLGSFAASELDAEVVRRHVPFFLVDHQARNEDEKQWAAGRDAKRTRALYPHKRTGLITSVGPEQHGYRWKDSVNASAETVSWIVDGFVQGAFPWFTKFAGRIHDPRWVPAVERAFGLHRTAAPFLSGARPAARTLVWETAGLAPGRERHAADGAAQALVELRVPFEFVGDRGTGPVGEEDAAVVLLPETSRITADAAARLRAFVEGGGILAVTGAGPTIDGGTRLVTELAGIEVAQWRDGIVRNNYIERQVVTGGPLDETTRIVGGTRLATITVPDGARVTWRFTPDHPDLPMEEVYPRSAAHDPAVAEVPVGRGLVRIVAFNLAELYDEVLMDDHLALFADLLAENGRPPAAVVLQGAGLVDAAAWRHPEGYTFAFANLTSVMAMKGQQREVTPLTDLRAMVDLERVGADAVAAAQAGLLRVLGLRDDRVVTLDAVTDAGSLVVDLPAVKELGLLRLEW